MSQTQSSMFSALRRLRTAQAPPDTSEPASTGRHSADVLGEGAWWNTRVLLADLRRKRERAAEAATSSVRGVARVVSGRRYRRHVSRDAYWPVEYGW